MLFICLNLPESLSVKRKIRFGFQVTAVVFEPNFDYSVGYRCEADGQLGRVEFVSAFIQYLGGSDSSHRFVFHLYVYYLAGVKYFPSIAIQPIAVSKLHCPSLEARLCVAGYFIGCQAIKLVVARLLHASN